MNVWPALLVFPCLVFGQEGGRLAFAGDQLGMTLASFKQKYPHCSVEPFKGIGLVARQETIQPRLAFKNPLPTPAGKVAEQAYFFTLSPNGDDKARLYSILMPFNASEYPRFKKTFTQKYGNPLTTEINTMRNTAGSSFETETVTWKMGTSRVILRQRATRTDKGMIDFLDEEIQGSLALASPEK